MKKTCYLKDKSYFIKWDNFKGCTVQKRVNTVSLDVIYIRFNHNVLHLYKSTKKNVKVSNAQHYLNNIAFKMVGETLSI